MHQCPPFGRARLPRCCLKRLGIYEPFQEFAGAGALIPVMGFGSSITKGMLSELERLGWEGLFTGALKSQASV